MLTQTTIGSLDCLLLLEMPDLSQPLGLELTHETRLLRGRTRRENRAAKRSTMVVKQSFQWVQPEAVAQDWRDERTQIGTDLVAVPVWADWCLYADYATRYFDAQYWITFNDDFSAYALNAGTYANYAPLMFARLDKNTVAALTDTVGDTRIQLTEDAPYSHRLAPKSESVGSDWPTELVPNWVESPQETYDDGLEYQQYARGGRTQSIENPETPGRYEQTAPFDLANRTDIKTLLNFWYNKQGRKGAFSVPSFLQPGTATDEAPHGFEARFASDTLSLDFVDLAHCTTTLKFIQLPWELNPVSGETPEQPAEAWLWKIDYEVPSKSSLYFTDWDADITYSSNTYTPFDFEVASLDMDLGLRRLDAQLKYHSDASDPIVPFVQAGLESRVQITLYEGDPATPSTFVARFTGTLKNATTVGREARATFKAFGGALDLKLPWFSYMRSCQYSLGDALCTLDLETLKNVGTGAVADLGANNLSLYARSLSGTLTNVLDPNSDSWDRFAGGFLVVGSADNYQIREIVKSDYEAGTNRTVYFDAPLDSTLLAAAGTPATVTLYPGCSGTAWECTDAHSNYANFGGMPHMPDTLNQLQGSGAGGIGGK